MKKIKTIRSYTGPVREQLIEIIRAEGFDTITAGELATQCLKECRIGCNTFTIGSVSFTITRK